VISAYNQCEIFRHILLLTLLDATLRQAPSGVLIWYNHVTCILKFLVISFLISKEWCLWGE